jgi:glycosyltransferase involved in cell wall biosynthesis
MNLRDPSRVFVVVPTFNEGSVLVGAIVPLLSAGYSIVVVDDGSTDDTYKQASRLPLHLLRHPINLGQGAALQTGMTCPHLCIHTQS